MEQIGRSEIVTRGKGNKGHKKGDKQLSWGPVVRRQISAGQGGDNSIQASIGFDTTTTSFEGENYNGH